VKRGCARADSEGDLINSQFSKAKPNSIKQTYSREKITRRSPEAGEKISSSPQIAAGVFPNGSFPRK
jgi:hypothetical protein